jgi:hypothetical protein
MGNRKNKRDSFKKFFILGGLIILIIVLLTLNFTREKETRLFFTDARLSIAAGGLNEVFKDVETNYGNLFAECSDQGSYDKHIGTDSRIMSAAELKEALALHEECGMQLHNKANLTLGFFKTKIDRMTDAVSVLRPGTYKKDANQILAYWEKIYDLEKENNTIYKRLVDIQGEYWTADLNKVTGIDSSAEREAKFGALNYEANQKLDLVKDLREDIKRVENAEGVLWGESFATTTK